MEVARKSDLRLSQSSVNDSSVLLNMCPLSMNLESSSYTHERPRLINTKKSKKVQRKSTKSSLQSNSLQISSADSDSIRSYSPSLSQRDDGDNESITQSEFGSISQGKTKKKYSYQNLMKLLSQQSGCDSIISSDSLLTKLLLHPTLNDNIEVEPSSPSPSVSCTSTPVCLPSISPDRILQFKQRQIELDRTVEKLIETIKYESNKSIEQIFRYWSYIKHISLEKYQSKINPYHLLDSLFKYNYFNQNYEDYFEQHDEIKAALQVLSTTLTIVHNEQSIDILNKIFDTEEKAMRENFQYQLDFLIGSYMDELSFIRESIHVYQSYVDESKTFDWIQIIQIEYPCLIEKLSNDFLTKIPQIQCNLLQLIRNTKKSLLNLHLKNN